MKTSTLCPLPAGSCIVRDNRCWHGGTPNLSAEPRLLPNVEYFAPWFRSEYIVPCMPYERWAALPTAHARRICRLVVAPRGEAVLGAGFLHPQAAARRAARAAQLAALAAPPQFPPPELD